jgi:transforming growth factor-beta-induced protein
MMKVLGFSTAVSAIAHRPTQNIVELAESVADLSTLVAAVVGADLADTLSSAGPFTVFAPTNDAFAALPAGTLDSLMKPENKAQLVDILTYHVLPEQVLSTDLDLFQAVKTVQGKNVHVTKWGGVVQVGASLKSEDLKKVTAADNLASNGVAHIIDGVLLPPTPPKQPNIVELAQSVADLSTLVAALVGGDLVDTLSTPGPFTVFAPTNEAFGALPAGTLDTLLKPENKAELVDILTYHVVPAKVLSKDLDLFQAVTTVEGKPLHVQKWGGVVQVGPSLQSKDLKKVTVADNIASNGVAHIIDGVLLPPADVVV